MVPAATSRAASSSARAATRIAIGPAPVAARWLVLVGWSPARLAGVPRKGAAIIGGPAAVLRPVADVVRGGRAALAVAPAADLADVVRAGPAVLAVARVVVPAAVREVRAALAVAPVAADLAAVVLADLPVVRVVPVDSVAAPAVVAVRVVDAAPVAPAVAVVDAVLAGAVVVAAVAVRRSGVAARADRAARVRVRPIATPRVGRSPTRARSIPIGSCRRRRSRLRHPSPKRPSPPLPKRRSRRSIVGA